MKVKIIKNFVDKETGKFNLEGNEIECKINRAKELEEKGYVELLEQIEETKKYSKKEDLINVAEIDKIEKTKRKRKTIEKKD